MKRIDRVAPRAGPLDALVAQDLVERGHVFVDGRRCLDPRAMVRAGARLVIHDGPPIEAPPLVVLYEDERLVALDKQPGDHLNATETSPAWSVVERLAARIASPFVVHRLDRETSGVVVLAKGAEAAAALSAAFAERRVQKEYRAITEGIPAIGIIDHPIGPDPRRPRARKVRPDGKPSRSEVLRVVARRELAAVALALHTGRTHQLRVHLAHQGQPIVGDRLYGGPTAVSLGGEVFRPDRALLHARRLELPDLPPLEAPLPADLAWFAARGLALDGPTG